MLAAAIAASAKAVGPLPPLPALPAISIDPKLLSPADGSEGAVVMQCCNGKNDKDYVMLLQQVEIVDPDDPTKMRTVAKLTCLWGHTGRKAGVFKGARVAPTQYAGALTLRSLSRGPTV